MFQELCLALFPEKTVLACENRLASVIGEIQYMAFQIK
jgi:hypothetical protein